MRSSPGRIFDPLTGSLADAIDRATGFGKLFNNLFTMIALTAYYLEKQRNYITLVIISQIFFVSFADSNLCSI